MKGDTMKKHIIALALATALTQTSCATVAMAAAPSVLNKITQRSDAPKTDDQKPATNKRSIFKGAGIGCAVGAGLSVLLGKKDDALKGCAVGAVAGGLIAYQKQVTEARELAAIANANGMKADVKTREVTDKDGKKGEALDTLSIKYNPADMMALDNKTVATLDKIALLGKKAKNSLTFTFSGKSACEIPLHELQKRGAFERHTVVNKCGSGASQIQITPVPEI
jgi:hypothetical protein